MDYLNRDSFFTGVSEGVISFDRIIKMFNVREDDLVIEEKGIYSIEKFLIARRLMYWQVYLHKAVIAGEMLLVKILERAKQLAARGNDLFAPPSLEYFLQNNINELNFFDEEESLKHFTKLDDQDIHTAVKVWATHNDKVLATLSSMLVERHLYKVEISAKLAADDRVEILKDDAVKMLGIADEDSSFFVFIDVIKNRAYNAGVGNIKILMKNNEVLDIAKASDLSNLESLQKTVEKFVLCYPRGI